MSMAMLQRLHASVFLLMLRAPSYLTVRKNLDWCVMVTCESLDVDIAGRVGGNIPQVASRTFTLDE
jgi:hypothetical protein